MIINFTESLLFQGADVILAQAVKYPAQLHDQLWGTIAKNWTGS